MPSNGEVFSGHYRKVAKTTIVRTKDGKVGPVKKFADLKSLLARLVPDKSMRAKYPRLIVRAGDEKAAKAAPGKRVKEETQNVQVDCWIYHVRSEGDGDYHTIVGSSRNASQAEFLNAEVSGLPTGGKDLQILKRARRQLNSLVKQPVPKKKYEDIRPPRKVRITGSLFFDGDHLPGRIGPGSDKPGTVWEIHPVVSIKGL